MSNSDCWRAGREDLSRRQVSADRRRRFGAHYTALNLYERLLYPGKEGTLEAALWVKIPEEVDRTRSHLDRLVYGYNPDRDEEVQVRARLDEPRRVVLSPVVDVKRRADVEDRRLAVGYVEGVESLAVARLLTSRHPPPA